MSGRPRTQLIVDCGGRVMSALFVTAEGETVPWSQQIHGVATRHVSLQLLFDGRASERAEFSWEEATEALMGTGPHNLLDRARRLGLRRPWDGAPAEALLVKSPLEVLSSAGALADPAVQSILPRASGALLSALLAPLFTFAAERAAPGEIDVILILPAHAGRHARLMLRRLFRRHGHRRLTIVHRELAVAMSLIDDPPESCVVRDVTGNDLHVYTLRIDADGDSRSFTTIAASTIRGAGWRHWAQEIAAALQMPWAVVERGLTSLLTGSPESLPRLTSAAVDAVCNAEWCEQQRNDPATPFTGREPAILAGEICGIEAIRQLIGPDELQTPYVDRAVRGVASAALWLRGGASRILSMPHGGSIRVNTYRNRAVPLLTPAQLPAPGESCSIAPELRLQGGWGADDPIVLQLLSGADDAPEGNATLCVVPANADGGQTVRLRLHVRRSRSGRRLTGVVETGSARSSFAEELSVMGRPS